MILANKRWGQEDLLPDRVEAYERDGLSVLMEKCK